ncbi:hypothetical protein [Prochlorothrix hollandica]|uniref:Uncharacterized protein n=1 Tax=Prochlorothrix hollandica PCC 9006 = CALU 1027 TaxID=317619 RepID=A0A0M2PT42_PROHO|nr:hypothetical protein [Prochlorothrix hollandica]KKI98317.1 hypothetical protein PROH_19270 [Prochlorothrix hollandica PCC 9006 = CALU 1027]
MAVPFSDVPRYSPSRDQQLAPVPTAAYALQYQIKTQDAGVILRIWESCSVDRPETDVIFAIHVKLASAAAALIWLREYSAQLSWQQPPMVQAYEAGTITIDPTPTAKVQTHSSPSKTLSKALGTVDSTEKIRLSFLSRSVINQHRSQDGLPDAVASPES